MFRTEGNMRRFMYLSHTADVEFVAYGKTFRQAMENAALALLNVMLDLKKIQKENGKDAYVAVKEKAQTQEDLVWFTLQDILSKVDSKKLNAIKFQVSSIKTDKKNAIAGRLLYRKSKRDFAL
ncbi:MAG: archease, partial [Candidatus Micrarchaeota archaeon]|nr:archease [Candidatus Micrarchaeota archaeon]